MKTFNLYCDETRHLENDGKSHMLLGYISVPYHQLILYKEQIEDIKRRHHFYAEIKWSKVSKSQVEFYNDLIDFFFGSDIQFRAVVIPKDRIRPDDFGQSYDDFYYRMYYQLIYHKLDMSSSYNIYLDIKDGLSRRKVRLLKEILQANNPGIRTVQNIRSHESPFLQLADFLIGAIGYLHNDEMKVVAKQHLIERIKRQAEHPLNCSTTKNAEKLNLFFIELQ